MRAGLVPVLFGTPRARRLLGGEPSGVAISFTDGSMVVRDPTTAANNFDGKYTSKLTIVGALPWGPQGARFDASNYASLAMTAMPFSNTAGSVVMRFIPDVLPVAANAYLWAFSDGTTNNRIVEFLPIGASTAGCRVTASASATVSSAGSIAFVPGKNVLATAWANNDFADYVNAAADVTDNTVTLPTGMTTWSLGRNEALNGSSLIGTILDVLWVPRRMTNTELAARVA